MKKLFIIAVVLILVINCKVQAQNFYRCNLNYTNKMLDSLLNIYVSTFSRKLIRNKSIDSIARARLDYYLDVLQLNSCLGESFENMLDNIGHGPLAHREVFGNPDFFEKPKTIYISAQRNYFNEGVTFSGEIMRQTSLKRKYRTRIEDKEKFLEDIKLEIERLIENPLYQHMLQQYKNSKLHNEIIKKCGYGKYGLATKMLISEKSAGGYWIYEILIYNLINFSKPIKN